ncbi:hypothetical protein [Leuconostoc citreum]|uniref:hypothetical protein n=1 Tax=Leuconostoc citreum TaxID=33964 RepID=UPI00186B6167|nr:hypothetical protein [Leuconostoc citreum]MBE4726367.1 hypothetical protein [Leuconostoc citreum]
MTQQTVDREGLAICQHHGQISYPGLANLIFTDAIYGPRILRRVNRLLIDHPDGLSESGHDWYFGYLVCAYTQTHYGIKNLPHFTAVTKELFALCLTQLS